MSQLRRLSLNTVALVLSSGFKSVISLAFVVVSARVLGVGRFGSYELTLQYVELVLGLIATGLGTLLTRRVARGREEVSRSLSAAAAFLGALTLVGAVGMWLLPLALDYQAETNAAIRVAALVLLPGAFCRLLEAVFIALEVAHVVTVGTLVEGVLRVTGGITLLVLGYGVTALILVVFASYTCLLVVYVAALRRHLPQLRWDLQWPVLRAMVTDWRAFGAEVWLSNLSNSMPVIVLSAVRGEAAVGLYSAAFKVLRLGRIVGRSYSDAVFPHMARLFGESSEALHRLTVGSLRTMLFLVLPAIAIISVYSSLLIDILYSADFAGSSSILSVVVWVLLLWFLNPFLSYVLFAREEQMKSLQVAAIRLSVVAVASAVLIPPFGGVGAAWAMLCAGLCATVFYLRFALKGRWGGLVAAVSRTAPPTVGLAVILLFLHEARPGLALAGGVVAYVALAVIFGALTIEDLRIVRRLWRAEAT